MPNLTADAAISDPDGNAHCPPDEHVSAVLRGRSGACPNFPAGGARCRRFMDEADKEVSQVQVEERMLPHVDSDLEHAGPAYAVRSSVASRGEPGASPGNLACDSAAKHAVGPAGPTGPEQGPGDSVRF